MFANFTQKNLDWQESIQNTIFFPIKYIDITVRLEVDKVWTQEIREMIIFIQ